MTRSELATRSGPANDNGPARFVTSDPGEAHSFLRAAYADSTMLIGGRTDGFTMKHTVRDAGLVSLTTASHTMRVKHVVQPLPRVIVGRVLRGHVERETAGDVQRAAAGDLFLVAPPGGAHSVWWDKLALQLVSIDEDVLADVAAAAGCSRGSLRFTDFRGPDPAAAADLLRAMEYAAAELSGAGPTPPLVASAVARLIAARVLTTFPNTTTARPEPATDDAAVRPTVLRRAIAHIEAHAHEPIGVAEIAAAARVSPRTLQMAFRRHLATTPVAYLGAVRLHQAHRELVSADPTAGATVIDIALRWGFAHQGRFAARYRRTFGCTPSATLRG